MSPGDSAMDDIQAAFKHELQKVDPYKKHGPLFRCHDLRGDSAPRCERVGCRDCFPPPPVAPHALDWEDHPCGYRTSPRPLELPEPVPWHRRLWNRFLLRAGVIWWWR